MGLKVADIFGQIKYTVHFRFDCGLCNVKRFRAYILPNEYALKPLISWEIKLPLQP